MRHSSIYKYTYIYTYILNIYFFIIPGKKVNILSTGCRRYRDKNEVTKNEVEMPKSTQNQRKNSPYQQGKFFGCRRF